MIRMSLFFLCTLLAVTCAEAQEPKKEAAPKKLPPLLQEVIQLKPEQFIKRYDKNGDGKISREELPPFFAKAFPKAFAVADKNDDGKLDRDEVAGMLKRLRTFFAAGNPPPAAKEVEKIVDSLLKQFDTNQDSKISRQEAKGRLLEVFDQLDLNKDGFLDRKELRVVAERRLAAGPPKTSGPAFDFDALDKNADGRLTREELQGTALYNRFDEIDTDRNGMIDRHEFEKFLERERDKK